MTRFQYEIDELQKRVHQNERHLEEMRSALLNDGANRPAVIDLTEIKLRAENDALVRQIVKLEHESYEDSEIFDFRSPFV